MAKSSKGAKELSTYTFPSINSPRVSFHPSYSGAFARNTFLFESIAGTLEGLLVIYYAEPILRFFASASLSPTRYVNENCKLSVVSLTIGLDPQ